MNRKKENEFIIEKVEMNVLPKTHPDVIYNCFELMYGDKNFLKYTKNNQVFLVPFHKNKRQADLGVYLKIIPEEVFCDLLNYIFEFENCNRVKVLNSFNQYHGRPNKTNHYKIELPNTEEELLSRLSKKGRYNLRREKRQLTDLGIIKFVHFSNEQIPLAYVNKFFEFKLSTHNRRFHMDATRYLKEFFITDMYGILLNGNLISILFSCEQCDAIFLENLSFDTNYSRYSVGFILYEYFLAEMIKKSRTTVFLGSGELNYKKRFNSIEETTYNGYIYKNKFYRIIYGGIHRLKIFYNKKLL